MIPTNFKKFETENTSFEHDLGISQQPLGIYKLGGISFIISGILFLIKNTLEFILGRPPTNGTDILNWMSTGATYIAILSEFMFFEGIFLIPGILALYINLVNSDRNKTIFGTGLLALIVPVLSILNIFQARLIYPVYNIHITNPDIAEFVVTLYYGGLHAVSILFGIAIILLSLAMKNNKYFKYYGICLGSILITIESNPWIFGTSIAFISQILFTFWFLIVGLKLYRMTDLK